MATSAEQLKSIGAVKAELVKIQTETQGLLDKIAALDAAQATAGTSTPEVDAAMADLMAQAQIVDALVPDSIPPVPAPAPAAPPAAIFPDPAPADATVPVVDAPPSTPTA